VEAVQLAALCSLEARLILINKAMIVWILRYETRLGPVSERRDHSIRMPGLIQVSLCGSLIWLSGPIVVLETQLVE
jgi:hypothetical protein